MTSGRSRMLAWLIYPTVMTLVFELFALLQWAGASLIISTYLPVLTTAALVAVLESALPHRAEWRPPNGEVRTDLTFLVVVQLAFPPLIGFLFTYALIRPAAALRLPISGIWPHAWPIWIQAVLMVLVVDFLRYWLHRAAHQNDTLWRLHSVHHSVEQLYWLNTARFHPLEKALQMSLDSLPFLLMRVDARVLALYYVAYAANGFFQHCNITLHYGPLNYIVGSAETHRWHHSWSPRESNANYGNTVIVWDVLFGTWYLPKEREVDHLGLQDPAYPKSFLKYLVILRLALNEPAITYIGSPNPSTFLRLIDILNAQREMLLRSLATGTFEVLDALAPPLRRTIVDRLRPLPDRAALLAAQGELTFANVWPDIRLMTTWTGGSCGIALGRLRAKLPAAAAVMELGYQSTECRGTIALNLETTGGLPPLTHHFFEFVEQSAWDDGRPAFQALGELEVGRRYYVLITTASGLYRYFMNDLLEVTGLFQGTPLLRFVQKGRGVTSLTGEKLYEAQTIESVCSVASQCGFASSFFFMVADEQASAYRLFVEPGDAAHPDARTVAVQVDHRLGELNIEYHGKRASGRLRALDLVWLKPGAGEAYKMSCVRAGQREGQFKPVVLQYRKDLRFSFDDYVAS